MHAITVMAGKAKSLALTPVDPPRRGPDDLLVRCLEIGICGTDFDIADGLYGTAPQGESRLIIGHESLGEVIEAPVGCGFSPGDLVVGFVRRPDPVPCENCAVGEWDMCRNGRYTERGIKEAHGYAVEQYRLSRHYAVKLDPALRTVGILLEPASVVAKAWEQALKAGARGTWNPRRALVTGAGPIGLLAALIGQQQGLEMHVFDRATAGRKPALVQALGATYHDESLAQLDLRPDIVIDCTGAGAVVIDAFGLLAPNGVLCLAGLSSGKHLVDLDFAAFGQRLVLSNDVILGSVNANRRHYERAADILAAAPTDWLAQVITRHVPLSRWQEAFQRQDDDIKTVIDFAAAPHDPTP